MKNKNVKNNLMNRNKSNNSNNTKETRLSTVNTNSYKIDYLKLSLGIITVIVGLSIIFFINKFIFVNTVTTYSSNVKEINFNSYLNILNNGKNIIDKLSSLYNFLYTKQIYYSQFISLSAFIGFSFLALYVKWIAWNYFIRN